MSLIQEALKRQQEDGEPSNDNERSMSAPPPPPETPAEEPTIEILPGISAVPPVPVDEPTPAEAEPSAPPPEAAEAPKEEEPSSTPPMQTPILESSKSEKKKPNKMLIGVLILIVVFAVMKLSCKSDEVTDVADDTVTEESIEDTEVVTTIEPDEAIIVTREEVEETPMEVVEIEEPKVVKPAPPPKIEWPSLTLSAVMGKGNKGSAMINGELYGVDDEIDGVTFVGVGKNGIYLQYKGESRFLKRGQTTF